MDDKIKIGAGADDAFDFQQIMEFNGGTKASLKQGKNRKTKTTGKEKRDGDAVVSNAVDSSSSELRRVNMSFPSVYLPWMRLLADDRGQTLSNYLFDLFLKDFNLKRSSLEDKLKLKL